MVKTWRMKIYFKVKFAQVIQQVEEVHQINFVETTCKFLQDKKTLFIAIHQFTADMCTSEYPEVGKH